MLHDGNMGLWFAPALPDADRAGDVDWISDNAEVRNAQCG
jgi:hypothetical protein